MLCVLHPQQNTSDILLSLSRPLARALTHFRCTSCCCNVRVHITIYKKIAVAWCLYIYFHYRTCIRLTASTASSNLASISCLSFLKCCACASLSLRRAASWRFSYVLTQKVQGTQGIFSVNFLCMKIRAFCVSFGNSSRKLCGT